VDRVSKRVIVYWRYDMDNIQIAYKIHWYDQNKIIKSDGIVYASSEDEARDYAYRLYNGEPPGRLYLEPKLN
jgi:hypothetical protein